MECQNGYEDNSIYTVAIVVPSDLEIYLSNSTEIT